MPQETIPSKEEMIWKEIRCVDDIEPFKWKIIAIDIYWRMIMEFEWTEEETVFAYKTLEEAHCVIEKPIDKDIIEVDWIQYKRIYH